MRRVLLTTFLAIAAGCGSSNPNREIPYNPPPPTETPDMGPVTTPPDNTVGAGETRVTNGNNVRALGVDRSHNAYWMMGDASGDGGAIFSASLDYPGSARLVMSRATQVAFAGNGDVVVGWNTTRTSGHAQTTLSTFRSYNFNQGPVTIATNAVPGVAASDGDWLVFADNLSNDGASADLYLSKIDGSARTRLLAGVNVAAGCTPQLDVYSYRQLVISSCAAGSTSASIGTVNVDNATLTTVKSGLLPGFMHRGSWILFNDATASYYLSSAQTAGTLDKPLQLPVMAGSHALIYAVGKQLRSWDSTVFQGMPHDVALLSDAPVQLAASPDGAFIAYWVKAGGTHDLALVSVATGVSQPVRTDFAVFAGFTDDSTNLLLLDNYSDARTGVPAQGTLVAVPVNGGPARTLAEAVTHVQPARASKLLYTNSGGDAASALRLVDLSNDRAAVAIAKGVDVTDFVTDPDRSRVLYTRSKVPSQGLYSAAIP